MHTVWANEMISGFPWPPPSPLAVIWHDGMPTGEIDLEDDELVVRAYDDEEARTLTAVDDDILRAALTHPEGFEWDHADADAFAAAHATWRVAWRRLCDRRPGIARAAEAALSGRSATGV